MFEANEQFYDNPQMTTTTTTVNDIYTFLTTPTLEALPSFPKGSDLASHALITDTKKPNDTSNQINDEVNYPLTKT